VALDQCAAHTRGVVGDVIAAATTIWGSRRITAGAERRVWDNQAYRGQREAIRKAARRRGISPIVAADKVLRPKAHLNSEKAPMKHRIRGPVWDLLLKADPEGPPPSSFAQLTHAVSCSFRTLLPRAAAAHARWLVCAAPLPTLRPRPRERVRTARGWCGLLLLHRSGLAPPTPCRSPGALACAHLSQPYLT
jgi:hypothetical protein